MFEVTYHRKVSDDLSIISSFHQHAIKKAIEEKLTSSPEFFGKPLRSSLKGLRSLRVGNYRVVFQLKQKGVFVILIGHRSVVYKLIGRRM